MGSTAKTGKAFEGLQDQQGLKAKSDCLESLASAAPRGTEVRQDQPVHLVVRATRVPPDPQAPRAIKGMKESKVRQELRGYPVYPANRSLDRPESPARRGRLGFPARSAPRGKKVIQVKQSPDRKARKGRGARKEKRAKASKAKRARKVRRGYPGELV
jgi:hypothetical protein